MLLNSMYSVTYIDLSFWITYIIFGSNAKDTRCWLQYWYFVMDFMLLHFQGVIWDFYLFFQWYGNRCKYPEFILGLEPYIVWLSEIVSVCYQCIIFFPHLSMLKFLGQLVAWKWPFFSFPPLGTLFFFCLNVYLSLYLSLSLSCSTLT